MISARSSARRSSTRKRLYNSRKIWSANDLEQDDTQWYICIRCVVLLPVKRKKLSFNDTHRVPSVYSSEKRYVHVFTSRTRPRTTAAFILLFFFCACYRSTYMQLRIISKSLNSRSCISNIIRANGTLAEKIWLESMDDIVDWSPALACFIEAPFFCFLIIFLFQFHSRRVRIERGDISSWPQRKWTPQRFGTRTKVTRTPPLKDIEFTFDRKMLEKRDLPEPPVRSLRVRFTKIWYLKRLTLIVNGARRVLEIY